MSFFGDDEKIDEMIYTSFNEIFDPIYDDSEKVDINEIFENFERNIKGLDEECQAQCHSDMKDLIFCSAYLYIFMDNIFNFRLMLIELEKRNYDILEVRDHAELDLLKLCESYGKIDFIDAIYVSIARQEAKDLYKSLGSLDTKEKEVTEVKSKNVKKRKRM